MREVVFLDTSVLLNILDVPGKNGERPDVTTRFRAQQEHGATFVVPVAALIESGNHIAQLPNGHDRRDCAVRFARLLRSALQGEIPSATPVSLWTLDEQLAAHA